ncbi:hypothetical protein HPB50_018220 [Hyalomma asiaticum]|uniref:Uncharacterized protein n=1 Tax=Hyalomma asiaticum TaxID=266040 RepID=A0ACB7T1R7_HYAAI|nr:hypothetical protein HPB50_018220 [Hyalomma asiaticum]
MAAYAESGYAIGFKVLEMISQNVANGAAHVNPDMMLDDGVTTVVSAMTALVTCAKSAIVLDPFLDANEIRSELQLDVSSSTIRQRLRQAGLQGCVAAQKPQLTEPQRQLKLEFARAVQDWTEDKWHEVISTDEATFSTQWDQQRATDPDDDRYYVLYRKEDYHLKSHLTDTEQDLIGKYDRKSFRAMRSAL